MEYKIVKLKEVVTILGDGIHGTPKYKENGEYYFINGNNLCDGKIIIKQDTKRVDYEEYEKYKKDLNDRTLLVSINGTLGNIAVYNNEKCILGKSACYFNIKDNVNKQFIKYVLYSDEFQKYIQEYATGTTIKNMSLKAMREYEFKLPELDIQDKIAHILSNIDKKIELNNQINDNLYNISKNIFRNFYNNNTGKWQACKINDIGLYISDYVANGSFKSLAENVKIYDDKNYALFIRNTDLKVNFTQGRKYVDEHSYNFLNKSKLYGRELIISNVGDVGSIFLCPSFDIPMTLGNNVIMVDSKDTEVNYNYYLYYFFLSVEGQYLIDGITGGSAQPKFNKTDFRNLQIKLPSKEEIMNFNNKVIPMYNIIEKNIKENETLEQIRDTLLPKLMNGEIDLHKIEV